MCPWSVVPRPYPVEAATFKYQAPRKSQYPNPKHQTTRSLRCLVIGAWNFFGIWRLVDWALIRYSYRSAIIGSTLAARRAGSQQENKATNDKSRETPPRTVE